MKSFPATSMKSPVPSCSATAAALRGKAWWTRLPDARCCPERGCWASAVPTPLASGAAPAQPAVRLSNWAFFKLGVHHIAIGVDHGDITSVRVGGESVVAGEGILYV